MDLGTVFQFVAKIGYQTGFVLHTGPPTEFATNLGTDIALTLGTTV